MIRIKTETILLQDSYTLLHTYLDKDGLKHYKCERYKTPKASKTRAFCEKILDFFFGKNPMVQYVSYSPSITKTTIIHNAKLE